MFSLRSSPSSLVPCSLRGAVTAEAGMAFGARGLTVPRPKRVVMPIVYYDSGSGGYACSPYATGGIAGGNGGGYSATDFAGVFESGCDPAQVRASLQSRTPIGHPLEEESSGANAYYNNILDDEPSDCLFPMDGAESHPKDMLPESHRGSAVSGGNFAGRGNGMCAETTSVAVGRVTASLSSGAIGAGSGGGNSVGYGGCNTVQKRGVPMVSPATGATPPSFRSDAVGLKASHLRRAPSRAMVTGLRCVAPGMYRLRLSTSC